MVTTKNLTRALIVSGVAMAVMPVDSASAISLMIDDFNTEQIVETITIAHAFQVPFDGIDLPENHAESAEFLVGAQWGAASVVRLHHSTAAAAAMNKVVCETVRSWRK